MILFKDFFQNYQLKNNAISNIKFYQVLSSLNWNDLKIFSRDGLFLSDIGIVILDPSKGTHWVCYTNENYFHSYGCISPKTLSQFIVKRTRYCLNSEYKDQGRTIKKDSY